MRHVAIDVPEVGEPAEPYSYAIHAGDALYLAGQVELDDNGRIGGVLGLAAAYETSTRWHVMRPSRHVETVAA